LTDVGQGAMLRLEPFIDGAKQAGGRFRRHFPPDCVLIRRGELLPLTDNCNAHLTG
jgi:hypothetical protein